jgi:ferredoxin
VSDFVERKFGDLTVRIDRGACISTANCMGMADEIFVWDDETICAFSDEPGEIDRETLIEACQMCPVDALHVLDADGKQIVP